MLQSYGDPTPLFYGTHRIASQSGVQQGDPLGSLRFALAIDSIIRNIDTPFNAWYLDDGTIAGPAQVVTENLCRLIPSFAQIGLVLNPS